MTIKRKATVTGQVNTELSFIERVAIFESDLREQYIKCGHL